MRRMLAALAGLCMLGFGPLAAQTVPQFQVDPFWPKPLPNNWIFGQVASVAVGPNDHVWIYQRPRSLSEDEKGATLTPPRNKCCVPAPSVLEFDADGNFIKGWGGPGRSRGSPTSTASRSTRRGSSGWAATATTTA